LGTSTKRVADVGCGKGRFARIVKRTQGASVVALDLAEAMLKPIPGEIERVAASMVRCLWRRKAFDGAYATESLEHAVDIPRPWPSWLTSSSPAGGS
jgi:ubiquinone/menaquinone biosynthesis C-methylase UbiE